MIEQPTHFRTDICGSGQSYVEDQDAGVHCFFPGPPPHAVYLQRAGFQEAKRILFGIVGRGVV